MNFKNRFFLFLILWGWISEAPLLAKLPKDETYWQARYMQKMASQGIDFPVSDVRSWEKLYKATRSLKTGLIDKPDSFSVPNLQDLMIQVLDSLVPESGIWHYLQALHEEWFVAEQTRPHEYRPNSKSQEKQLESYRQGAEKGYKRAEHTYYARLFYRGVHESWWRDRFKLLKKADANGNPMAHQWLVRTLIEEKYIFDEEPSHWASDYDQQRSDMCWEELSRRAKAEDVEAKRWVYVAHYQGRFRLFRKSDAERFALLLEGEREGDPVAQQLVDKVIYHRDLGQKSDDEWIARMLEREEQQKGTPHKTARHYVNRSLLHGFSEWQKREGFKSHLDTLRAKEAAGDEDAGHCISKGLYDKKRFTRFAPYRMTDQERYAELVKRAKAGDRHALDYVFRIHGEGQFGQEKSAEFAESLFRSFVLFDLLTGFLENRSFNYKYEGRNTHGRDISQVSFGGTYE